MRHLPGRYIAPEEHRNLRRILRYCNLLAREAAKMKTKTATTPEGVNGAGYLSIHEN